ncbi:MAG: hypothetical protein M3P43_06690, partial [Actinomycetota bacterium]|nr:hypothetical protein [Actinomycetota bacterium]
MTKRSAMTMAAGLAFALLAGVVAISLTLGATPAANASRERKPLVKHQVQTVTVHRRAGSASPSGVQVIQLPPTSASTSSMESSSGGSSDDQGMDNESPDDGIFGDTSSDG